MIERIFPPNFTRNEMLVSSTAKQLGLSNEPHSEEIEENIWKTAMFLQRVRDEIAKAGNKHPAIRVYSCYRSPEVNKAVKGSKTSAHLQGLAADIVVDGWMPVRLAHFIADNFDYDQVINEFGEWVHVGIATGQCARKQMLTAVKEEKNGKMVTVYKRGFASPYR